MYLTKEIITLLDEKLAITSYLQGEELITFYAKIAKYLENRIKIEALEKELDETIKFYSLIGLSNEEMIRSISIWPAILHSNKQDLINKYFLLAKVVNGTTREPDREDILINHPKDFMMGLDLMYARYKHLESDGIKDSSRTEGITRRKLLKNTGTEFETSYGYSKEQLLKIYPLTPTAMEEIKAWPENEELLARLKKEKPTK